MPHHSEWVGGCLGRKASCISDFVSYMFYLEILTLLSLHCHFRTVRR
jgi:hypothetical protein